VGSGTQSAELLLETATLTVPVGFDTVTEHTAGRLGPRLAGVHDSAVTLIALGASVTEAVCDEPLAVAVMVALCEAEKVPVAAVKLAVVLPCATNTDAGTVRAAALLCSVTVAPPAGAVCVTVTVQDVFEPGARLEAPHCSAETSTGAASAIDAVALVPFSAAVRVAVWFAATVAVLTVKLAELAWAATVTDVGAVSSEAEFVKATVVAVPACESVTVQDVLAFCPRLEAVHTSEET